MSYMDTTLVPAPGYSHVNFKQVYDQIALQLEAHPAWSFVESVDYVAGAVTYRTFVWKCLAAKSGLPKDFHVGLRYGFNSATGVVSTSPNVTERGIRAYLFEDYNQSTKTATKIAPIVNTNNTVPVLLPDSSDDRTLVLNTFSIDDSRIASFFHIGMFSAVTSYRMCVGVTNGVLYVCGGTAASKSITYIGKFESVLTAVEDPMPIVIGTGPETGFSTASNTSSIHHYAVPTRHPLIGTGAKPNSFRLAGGSYHAANNLFFSGLWLYHHNISVAGILGEPSNGNYSMYLKGIVTSKCPIATSSTGMDGASRGGMRGFLLHMVESVTTSHSTGDTFEVDGKPYAGPGLTSPTATGLWDTTA